MLRSPSAKDSDWEATPWVATDGKGWLLDLVGSSVDFGMAWDEEQLEVSIPDPSSPSMWREPSLTTAHGWELSLGSLFSYRRGHYRDPEGTTDDGTSGWSVGLQYAGMGGVRYDRATTPRAYDPTSGLQLENVTHKGFVVFVDPIAISRFTRR